MSFYEWELISCSIASFFAGVSVVIFIGIASEEHKASQGLESSVASQPSATPEKKGNL